MNHLKEFIDSFDEDLKIDLGHNKMLIKCDDYTYNDPVDHSVSANQGLRFYFKDGSRLIFRLSGTGSAGATIRMYLEQYVNDESRLETETQV